MLTQYVFVGLVVVGAVCYAAWRVYARIKQPDRCRGCALSAQCRRHNDAEADDCHCSPSRLKNEGGH